MTHMTLMSHMTHSPYEGIVCTCARTALAGYMGSYRKCVIVRHVRRKLTWQIR